MAIERPDWGAPGAAESGGRNLVPAAPTPTVAVVPTVAAVPMEIEPVADPLANMSPAQLAAAETVARQLPADFVEALGDGPDADADDFVEAGWDEARVEAVWAKVVGKVVRVLATTPPASRLLDRIEARFTLEERFAWDTWILTDDLFGGDGK